MFSFALHVTDQNFKYDDQVCFWNICSIGGLMLGYSLWEPTFKISRKSQLSLKRNCHCLKVKCHFELTMVIKSEMITTVITVHPNEDINVCTNPSRIQNHNCQPHGGTRGKFRSSSTSLAFIIWEPQMSHTRFCANPSSICWDALTCWWRKRKNKTEGFFFFFCTVQQMWYRWYLRHFCFQPEACLFTFCQV